MTSSAAGKENWEEEEEEARVGKENLCLMGEFSLITLLH